MLEPDNRIHQQPTPLGIHTLMSSPQILDTIRTYQVDHAKEGDNTPIDAVLATTMIKVGSHYLRAVEDYLLRNSSNLDTAPSPTTPRDMAANSAAVTFGVAYLALRNFITTATPDSDGNYTFNNADFVRDVDNAIKDTPIERDQVLSSTAVQRTARELIKADEWNKMIGVARDFGFAALLNGRGWVQLPFAISQLIDGFDMVKDIQNIVENFQRMLIQIETMTEREKRLASIPRVIPARRDTDTDESTQSTTAENKESFVDTPLVDLLGYELRDLLSGL